MALRNTFTATPSFVPSVPGATFAVPAHSKAPFFAQPYSLDAGSFRHEDEDAHITGGTRSLNRRLLALNLDPAPTRHLASAEAVSARNILPRSA